MGWCGAEEEEGSERWRRRKRQSLRMSGMVLAVTEQDQLSELLENDKRRHDLLVVVDLFRKWAGPCVVMEPTYEALMDSLERGADKVALVAVAFEDMADWLGPADAGLKARSAPAFDSSEAGKRDKTFYKGIASLLSAGERQRLVEVVNASQQSCKPATVFLKSRPIEATEKPVSLAGVVHGADAPLVQQTFQTAVSQCVLEAP